MVGDNQDVKGLVKKMNHNPKAFFLYNPQGNYVNAMSLYKSLQKTINEKYYGAVKKKKSKSNLAEDHEQDEKPSSFKGTVFAECVLPYDVFHMNRRTKNTVNQALSRVGFLMLRDGSLQIEDSTGHKKPELTFSAEVVKELALEYQLSSQFIKPDYFVPIPMIEGMQSAEKLQKTGIQIHCLESRLIYPLYGVWTPTSQEYLNLLSNYVQQTKTQYSRYASMVDLGCGSGILPIVLSENGGFEGDVHALDSQ